MEWNPEYQYKIRGTWAVRGNDQIIIFDLPNATPVATIEDQADGKAVKRTRRIALCAEEWGDSFGTEFYAFNLQNAFYYINPHIDWKAQAKSHVVPDSDQVTLLSEEELLMNIEKLRTKAGVAYGE